MRFHYILNALRIAYAKKHPLNEYDEVRKIRGPLFVRAFVHTSCKREVMSLVRLRVCLIRI